MTHAGPSTEPRPRSLASDILQVARCDRACRDLAARRNEAEARAVARIQKCGDRYVACSEYIAEVGPDGRLMLSRFSYAHELDALDDLADGPPPVADAATASEPDTDADAGQEELRLDLAETAAAMAAAHPALDGRAQPTDEQLAEMAYQQAFDDVFNPMSHVGDGPVS
jgi:hypothetical protein